MSKIAVLLHDCSLGGTERVALELAHEWRKAGRKVVLLLGHDRGAFAGMVDPDIEIVTAPGPMRRGRGQVARLGRWAAEELADRPDVTALFIPGNYHFPAIRAIRARNPNLHIIAKISNILDRPDRPAWRRGGFAMITRRRLAGVDVITVLGESLRADAETILGRDVRIVVAFDPCRAAAVPAPSHPPGTALIAVGRLVGQKNIALLVDAMAQPSLAARHLLIVGDGPQRGVLELRARTLGIADRIEFVGIRHDVSAMMEASALLLLSSLYEGYPAVAIEALAAGIGVVTTDCTPAMDEILPSPSLGCIVRSLNPADFALAVAAQLDGDAFDRDAAAPVVSRHRPDLAAGRYLALCDGQAAAA